MKVLIINQHSDNFGDDAAGCALIKMILNNTDANCIDIIYHANASREIPVYDQKIIHHLDISFGKIGIKKVVKYYLLQRCLRIKPLSVHLRKWINLIREADAIFVSPCGANIGIYKDWSFLLKILMVIIEGKSPIFQYNTIGSSGNIIFDYIALYALKKSHIYVREESSRKYLDRNGIKAKWGPDTAFALGKKDDKLRNDVVTFVPSSFDSWHPEFKDDPIDKKIQEIVIPQITRWVNKNCFSLEIIPHLNSKEEFKYNKIVLDAFKKAGLERISLREDINSVWDYDEALETSRVVIGMRYHAVVLAAKNCRPYLALCYENKMKEVCRYTDMLNSMVDIHQIISYSSGDKLIVMLDTILKDEDKIVNKLKVENNSIKSLCLVPIKDNCGTKGK